VGPGPLTPEGLGALQEAFAAEHERTYGYRSEGEPVQIVALRLVARGLSAAARVPARLRLSAGPAPAGPAGPAARLAHFGPDHGWLQAPLLARGDLASGEHEGPLIVEEYDATTVVPPGWRVSLDPWGSIAAVSVGGASR
jgi:N-methylhydantoinase A